MDTLILSRARYRRRYGPTRPSHRCRRASSKRFPPSCWRTSDRRGGATRVFRRRVWSSGEDHDSDRRTTITRTKISGRVMGSSSRRSTYSGPAYNSIDNIADFFASRGKKFSRPKLKWKRRREARIAPGRARPASQVWRRNGLSSRRRWGRRQDYGTISTRRPEEAGRKVRAAGKLRNRSNTHLQLKGRRMPNTTALPKEERKDAKRTARKKAAPKPKRTSPRFGEAESQEAGRGTASARQLGNRATGDR